ncbi:MAG: hypothetical protein GWN13_20695 [Phycisphaerae bacterium]|nr:hypothetical protein [Phycisphaerae bacterium]NIX00618.1 hypothetical protein [Phycisphaerae bacterium]
MDSVCRFCYAGKGNYLFPAVKRCQEQRYEAVSLALSNDIEFNRFAYSFAYVLKRLGLRYFRWHDSGDIVSVRHLLLLVKIAELCPRIRFWLPTKEYAHVRKYLKVYGAFPSNFVVRVSAPMVDLAAPVIQGTVTNTVHRSQAPIGKVCNAYKRKGSCGRCRSCWNLDVSNVSYPLH